MELIDYLRMLARRWRWVVALTLVGLIGGALSAVTTPRVYEASALLFVGNSGNSSSGENRDDLSASRFTLERMQSYAALVRSPEVTRAVNDQLQLGVDPEDIADVLSASVLRNTVVLQVTASGGEPVATANIANVAAARLGAVIELVEAPGTGAASPVNVTVTRPANAPRTPTSPNVALALALGLVAGLGAGVLAAALRDQALSTRTAGAAQASAVDDDAAAAAFEDGEDGRSHADDHDQEAERAGVHEVMRPEDEAAASAALATAATSTSLFGTDTAAATAPAADTDTDTAAAPTPAAAIAPAAAATDQIVRAGRGALAGDAGRPAPEAVALPNEPHRHASPTSVALVWADRPAPLEDWAYAASASAELGDPEGSSSHVTPARATGADEDRTVSG